MLKKIKVVSTATVNQPKSFLMRNFRLKVGIGGVQASGFIALLILCGRSLGK